MALTTNREYTSGPRDPANFTTPDAYVEVDYDDVTGAIADFRYVVNRGVLRVEVDNPPRPMMKQDFIGPSSGTFLVPQSQGYTMSLTPKGHWYWKGPPTARYRWGTSVAALDASEGL